MYVRRNMNVNHVFQIKIYLFILHIIMKLFIVIFVLMFFLGTILHISLKQLYAALASINLFHILLIILFFSLKLQNQKCFTLFYLFCNQLKFYPRNHNQHHHNPILEI